jgi:hypothetical protein
MKRMNSHLPASVNVTDSLPVTDSASASIREDFSTVHLLSAAIFCRSVGKIESANFVNFGRGFGDYWEELQANAIAVVFAATASFEAYANELFIDHAQVFPCVSSLERATILQWFETKKNNEASAFDKLNKALAILKLPPIDFRNSSDYQDICVLRDLRNALVHYKPEWFDEQDKHAELSKKLENKAVRSPFLTSTQFLKEPLFPRAWASHDTAVWAIRSVTDSVRKFEGRADIKTGYSSRFSLPQLNDL